MTLEFKGTPHSLARLWALGILFLLMSIEPITGLAVSSPGEKSPASPTPTRGHWLITSREGARLQLELQWDDDTQWRRFVVPSDFQNLSAPQMSSATTVPVSFRMEQDAGSFVFEGNFRNGHGKGEFHFEAHRQFIPTLHSLGIRDVGEVTDHDLKNLAFGGLSAAAIREFQALDLEPLTMEDVVTLAIRQVPPDYARAMTALKFSPSRSISGIIDLWFRGVTPEYVRELRGIGPTRR